MRCKLNIIGFKDASNFANAAETISGEVFLVSANGKYRVNAKSLMSCILASSEWGDDVWVETAAENYSALEKWIEVAADDAANIHS